MLVKKKKLDIRSQVEHLYKIYTISPLLAELLDTSCMSSSLFSDSDSVKLDLFSDLELTESFCAPSETVSRYKAFTKFPNRLLKLGILVMLATIPCNLFRKLQNHVLILDIELSGVVGIYS